MKAILVINLPDGYGEIIDNKATFKLKNWKLDTSLTVCNVSLKPLPEKEECDSYMMPLHDYCLGWNDCLDEILGETE